MDNERQDTTVDASIWSGITSGRSSEPLTRQDIPVIIEEVTRQLHWDNDGSHSTLTPGMCCVYRIIFRSSHVEACGSTLIVNMPGSQDPLCQPGDHVCLHNIPQALVIVYVRV